MQLQVGREHELSVLLKKTKKPKKNSQLMILIQFMQKKQTCVYKHVITTSQCFDGEGVFFNGSMDVMAREFKSSVIKGDV